jgi:molybdate transport system substrate-binding protein
LALALLAQKNDPQPLLVAAASDLAPAEQALTETFQKEIGGSVRFVMGSSGQLAAQIRNGAPYDLFLSANLQYVRELEGTGHIVQGSGAVYATGRLGLWSRDGRITTLEALASDTVVHVAIANPGHAPYGVAAKQLLQGVGLWSRIEPKVVLAENVRQAYQFAERGNADAAILAWTLVHDKGGVRLPDSRHDPILQAGGVVSRSARKAESEKLLKWLRSGAGRQILGRYGLFLPPRDNSR